MRKSNKKGFTIVELVIVIAVVAILAAVLIPTFVNVVNKANVSNDIALVRNINTTLATEEVDGKPATMHEALEMAARGGFTIDKLTPRSSGDIVWDSETNRFALVNGDETVYSDGDKVIEKTASVWRIVKSVSEAQNSDGYSSYIVKQQGEISSVTVKTGLDVGENVVSSVTYNGKGVKQAVTIYTNGGTLTVNAATDTVQHYGLVSTLKITAVAAEDCYHEHGFVVKLESFGTGKFIAESGAEFHQSQTEIEAVLGSSADLTNALFEKHYYDEDGVCVDKDVFDPDTHTHTWGDWEFDDEANHKHTCSVCNYSETARHTDLTESTKCSECGYESAFVAAIGSTGYSTLAAAFEAAQQAKGGSIKLLKNVELSSAITVDSLTTTEKYTFALDLNGKKITSTGRTFSVYDSLFVVKDSSDCAEGMITAESLHAINGGKGGNITIESGTVTALKQAYAVYLIGEFNMIGGRLTGAALDAGTGTYGLGLGGGAVAKISGGTINGLHCAAGGDTSKNISLEIGIESSNNDEISILGEIKTTNDYKVNLKIKSGTFSSVATIDGFDSGEVSITGGAFQSYKPNESYIASGYSATQEGAYWVVKKDN